MKNYNSSQNKPELFAYAQELGLDLDSRLGVVRIKGEIKQQLVALGIDEPEPEVKSEPEKRVKIIIHKTEGVTGSSDVQVSVNGKVTNIKRGHVVNVLPSVVEVLENAIKTEYTFVGEGEPLEENLVLSYPFGFA